MIWGLKDLKVYLGFTEASNEVIFVCSPLHYSHCSILDFNEPRTPDFH